MKRLTEEKQIGPFASLIDKAEAVPVAFATYDCLYAHMVAVTRLKEYEDTGLEPEEVTAMKNAIMGQEIAKITEFDGIPIQRLQELAQAEKDGRLVELPVKLGDAVYMIRDQKIITATIESIHQWCSGNWKANAHTDKRYTHWVGYEICFDEFCKTVFLTREEAEAALEKREDVK